jgi:DNA-binding NarL/FixJ family response regulator
VPGDPHARNRPEALSPRENEVLRLLAGGLTNKQMAQTLEVGEKTIKTQVSRILGKVGVQSRTQPALYVSRIGLLSVDELGGARRPTTT